jgi:circadian clock protein KaiB
MERKSMNRLKLRLIIAGRTTESEQALQNVTVLCDADLPDGWEIEVIDILEERQRAWREQTLATPTLIRLLPEPVRRIIGDLGDRRQLRIGLGLPLAGGLSS